ncbi:hypothetical protein D5366_08785 [Neokomagataea tanensis]|uniref:Uncharacterized protein n=1 Tax=Neokomagataea tanensis TaxID=661191 RepID=A0A4Y6VA08_9PROT|nr:MULTISPECIES: hypothetical protein [Neokomagataea]QDH25287.1 hypothetical protein D5366_08785 [Neokomagataea tanensis]
MSNNGILSRFQATNDGRGLIGNVMGAICVSCAIGLAFMFCRNVIKTDMHSLTRLMLLLTWLYFLVPWLVLRVTKTALQKTGE